MNKYSAEDFARVEFAKKRLYRACRSASGFWRTESGTCLEDGDMGPNGWEPYNPYSLEELARAWGAGEEPEPGETATQGMVSMQEVEGGSGYHLYVNAEGADLLPVERIVYRPPAPERDPVDDLAQIMAEVLPEEAGSSVALRRYAQALADCGVRVVTDDE